MRRGTHNEDARIETTPRRTKRSDKVDKRREKRKQTLEMIATQGEGKAEAEKRRPEPIF